MIFTPGRLGRGILLAVNEPDQVRHSTMRKKYKQIVLASLQAHLVKLNILWGIVVVSESTISQGGLKKAAGILQKQSKGYRCICFPCDSDRLLLKC
eukprot:scaffold1328_cov162-Amphora_coffeaeformis.AAC.7